MLDLQVLWRLQRLCPLVGSVRQACGDRRHELTRQLRTGRAMRRPKDTRLPDGRGLRPNTLNIG